MTTNPLLDAAVVYAERGWPVFPCHHPCSGSCSCRTAACSSVAKHPRTRRGLHEATTDRATIERWWRAWPRANVATRTGARAGGDGLVVVDVDPRHGGEESLDALLSIHGPLPPTGVVHTGSGGLHLYFCHPGRPVPNSAGTRLGPGLDVRGDGGYVIAPPSVHANGGTYEWTWVAGPAALPGWLAERLVTPPRRPTIPPVGPPRLDPGVSAWASAALAGELGRIAATPEGGRNHALNRSAFVLGQLVGGGHLDRGRVAEALEHAGQSVGLGAHEVQATVRSGLDAGEALPRHPAERSITSSSPPSPALAKGEANGFDLGRCDLPQAASRVPLPDEAAPPRAGIDLGWPA